MPNAPTGSSFDSFDRGLRSLLDEPVGPRRTTAPAPPQDDDPFLRALGNVLETESAADQAPRPRIGVPALPPRDVPAPPEPSVFNLTDEQARAPFEMGGMLTPQRTTDIPLAPPRPTLAAGGINAAADVTSVRTSVPTFVQGASLAERFGERILGPLVAKAAPKVADVGISAVKGAVGMVQAGVGAIDVGTEDSASFLMDRIGFQPEAAKRILDTYYSDPQRRAFQNVAEAEGVVGKAVAALENPSVILHSVVESAPTMVAAAAIARSSGLPPAVAGGFGEGVMSGGATWAGMRAQNPNATEADRMLAMASGAATGALGVFSGRLAQSLGITDVDTLLAGAAASPAAGHNLARRTLLAAVQEGFLEELPQSVQEQVAQNIGANRPIWEGVDDAAVLGALTGAVMGGGTQILARSPEASQSRGPATFSAPWNPRGLPEDGVRPSAPPQEPRMAAPPQQAAPTPVAPPAAPPVPAEAASAPVPDDVITGRTVDEVMEQVAAFDAQQREAAAQEPAPSEADLERERAIDALMAKLEAEAAAAPPADATADAPRAGEDFYQWAARVHGVSRAQLEADDALQETLYAAYEPADYSAEENRKRSEYGGDDAIDRPVTPESINIANTVADLAYTEQRIKALEAIEQPTRDERAELDRAKTILRQLQNQEKLAAGVPRDQILAEDVVTPELVEPEATSEALAPREQLYVVRGRDRLPVDSVEDAATKWEEFRDAVEEDGPGAGGVSELGNGLRVERADGTEVARISYNGRIWNPDGTVYRAKADKPDVALSIAAMSLKERAISLDRLERMPDLTPYEEELRDALRAETGLTSEPKENPADVARRLSKEDFAAQARRWNFTPDAARAFWDIAHKPAQDAPQAAAPTPETRAPQAATSGPTVAWDEEHKSVTVKFPKKPLASTLDTLKKEGFKWSKSSQAWFHRTPGDLVSARPDKSRNIRGLAVDRTRAILGLPSENEVEQTQRTPEAQPPNQEPIAAADVPDSKTRTTSPQQATKPRADVPQFAVGDKVEMEFDGRWYPTTVTQATDAQGRTQVTHPVIRMQGILPGASSGVQTMAIGQASSIPFYASPREIRPAGSVTETPAPAAPAPAPKAAKTSTRKPQDATKPQRAWRVIGKNTNGHDVAVDANGVRSYVASSGVRHMQPVRIAPTREGVQWWKGDTPSEYLTVEEAAAVAATKADEPSKSEIDPKAARRAELAAKRAALKDEIAAKVDAIQKEVGKLGTQLNAGIPVPPRALVSKVYDLAKLYAKVGIVDLEDGWLSFEEDFGEGYQALRRAFELAWDMVRPTVAEGSGTAQTGTEESGDATDQTQARGDAGPGRAPDVRGPGAATDRAGGRTALADVPAAPRAEPRSGGADGTPDGDSERVAPDGVSATPAAGGRDAGGARLDGVSGTPLSPTGSHADPGPRPADYVLTPERIRAIIDRGDAQRLYDNIAAIKIIKDLRESQRHATPDEQEALAKYVGWGASAMAAFLEDYPRYDWSEPQRKAWQTLQELTTKEERAALVRSTPNAHFTFDLYRPIWAALERFGFAGGRILEPAIGAGHAFGMMPASIRANASLQGVELDPITATIAQALYPSARVQAVGYEQSRIAKGTQDLVISNVPFGPFGVIDKSKPASITHRIHNYFFDKALDHARDGGYVVFVSSRFTLDATTESAFRRHLMTRAHFVGAVRLPNTAFDKTAKTEVITDIIVLQKRMADETGPSRNAEQFINANDVPSMASTSRGRGGKQVTQKVYRSAWYEAHPELILGTESTGGTMYGGNEYTVTARASVDLEDEIQSALTDILPANSYTSTPAAVTIEGPTMVLDAFKAGEFRLGPTGDLLTVNQDGEATPYTHGATGKPLGQKEVDRIKGMVGVRNALRTVMTTMADAQATDADVAKAQKALTKVYLAFEKAYGPLTSNVNRRLFARDPESANLTALEITKVTTTLATDKNGKKVRKVTKSVIGRADIFTKRTIQAQRTVERVDTPEDALLASLGVRTVIDWPYMARISGQPAEALQQALVERGRIFKAPDGTWVTSDQYLSGDVVTKLEDAKAAVEAGDASFARNVKALEAVQPEKKTADKIKATLGSHWIPIGHVEDFAKAQNKRYVTITRTATSSIVSWEVRAADGPRHDLAVVYKRGEKTYGFADMLEDALNLRQPELGWWEGSGDDRHYVKDVEATTAAKANLDELRERWLTWVVEHPELEQELVDIYNSRFNRTVPWVPDGSHLLNIKDGERTAALPGLALPFPLYPHQLRAVWRILTSGNTLLAHEVGAGKTFEMIIAAMEMRRTGRAAKPMITVPTYLLGPWRADILRAYPQAKLLAFEEDDLSAPKRQAAMAKIATGDWDIVLVPHSSFTLLKNSDARMAEVLQGFVTELEDAIKEERERSGEKAKSVKQLETQRRKLQDKLHDRLEAAQKGNDNNLTWDQLGIDALFVDEAHAFKNLYFHTNMDNLKGLSRSESDRSLDLYVKIGSINAQSNHRNVVLATATPIMNSLVELYTMQRYLQPNTLREQGVEAFDAWYTMFAEAANVVEPSPDGSFAETRRLKHFRNLKTLYQMAVDVMDYVGWKDMPYLNLPAIKGGKVEILEAPPHPIMQRLTEWFTERLAILKQNPPRYDHRNKTYVAPIRVHPITGQSMGRFDNHLTVMGDATLAAIDPRMVIPGHVTDFSGSRVQVVAEEAAKTYREEADTKGTVLIFLDHGTPQAPGPLAFMMGEGLEDTTGGDALGVEDELSDDAVDDLMDDGGGAFNLYDALRDALVRQKIPARQIAYVHQAQTPAERVALFEAVNKGEVRILIASTDKGGVGMNVQARMARLIEMGPPRYRRPGDIRQRWGRGIRQGNMYSAIQITRVVTKSPMDAWTYGLIATKQAQIEAFMRGDADELSEQDAMTLSIDEAMALASDNPLVVELNDLKPQLVRLRAQAAAAQRAQTAARSELASAKRDRAYWQQRSDDAATELVLRDIDGYTGDVPLADVDFSSDAFSLHIGGVTYTKYKEANEALVARMLAASASRHTGGYEAERVVLGYLRDPKITVTMSRQTVLQNVNGRMEPREIAGLNVTMGSFHEPAGDVAYTPEDPKRFEGRNFAWSIANAIDRLKHAQADADARVAEYAKQEAEAEAALKKAFPAQEKLAHLEKRVQDIEAELSAQGKVREAEAAEKLKTSESAQKSVQHQAGARSPQQATSGGVSDASVMPGTLPVRPAPTAADIPKRTTPPTKARRLEVPELVALAKALLGVPDLVKSFRKAEKMGEFRGWGGIRLSLELFKPGNEQMLAEVLAHEIGHLIDWLPDNVMTRGNLLGRLNTLHRYMRHTYVSPSSGIVEKLKVIKPELVALSAVWRPWDRAVATDSMRQYRDSARELYADGLSALLNDPGFVKAMAPKFYEAFFEGLHAKPDVEQAYLDLLDLVNGGQVDVTDARRGRLVESFEEGDVKGKDIRIRKDAKKAARAADLWTRFRVQLFTKHTPFADRVRQLSTQGKAVAELLNPVYALDERNYLSGKLKAWVQRHVQPLKDTLDEVKVPWSAFGELLFYDRILSGDSSEKANPQGLAVPHVRLMRDRLQASLSATQWRTLTTETDRFRLAVKDVARMAYEAGLYTEATWKDIEANPAYATFRVLDYMDQELSSRVMRRVGTIKDIQHPGDATVLKTLKTLSAIEHNRVKTIAIRFLRDNFAGDIAPARTIFDKERKSHRPIDPPTKDQRLVTFYEGGKWTGVYVDPYIADSLDNLSYGHDWFVTRGLRWINGNWFRKVFTGLNLGFQSYNLMKDFVRYWKNNPGYSPVAALRRYYDAVPLAKIRAYGLSKKPTAADFEAFEMMLQAEEGGMLALTFNDILEGRDPEETQVEQILRDVGALPSDRPSAFLSVRAWSHLMEQIRKAGDFVETLPKAAALYDSMQTMQKTSRHVGPVRVPSVRDIGPERREFIRRKIGSPDFLAGGTYTPLSNELFLFSNAIVQGWRADIEVARDPNTRAGWFWKTMVANVLPKVLMFAALAGWFRGDDDKDREDEGTLARLMRRISEYDLTNYTVVPLGQTAQGFTAYVRLPQDDTGRVIGGLVWKALQAAFGDNDQAVTNMVRDVVDYSAGQLPSVSPVINVASSSLQFLSGRNVYDPFRGELLLSDDEMKARDPKTGLPHSSVVKKFVGYEFQELGGGIVWRFVPGERRVKREAGDITFMVDVPILSDVAQGAFTAAEWPIVSNMLGRWLKVSNQGEKQALDRATEPVQAESSYARLEEKRLRNVELKALMDLPKPERTEGQYWAAARRVVEQVYADQNVGERAAKTALVVKKLQMGEKWGEADPIAEKVLIAGSIPEKVAVLRAAQQRMSADEWRAWVTRAQNGGIVSEGVWTAFTTTRRPQEATR